MAVADALISKVVDMLVSTVQQQFRLVAGVEEEVEKLTSSLQSIQAVLVDAETRQWKEAKTVQLWLGRLKQVVYDIDDVVDEWSTYEKLRSRTERDDQNAPKPTRKVRCFSVLSVCNCFPRVVSRHHIAVKISDLNARLDVIAIEKDRYGFQILSNNEQVERSITTPDIDMSEVKGREADKEKLVRMLLVGSSEMPKLRLIPVVGMGGIGKTTLARLVYNDERVKSHFHKRIWVCVSDPFDKVRIAKEILESLQGANSNLVALPHIMGKIQESFVEGKEYLFVLDDVWNEDLRKWKQLEDCLRGSLSKSRILVTTRNENVGRVMGCLESDVVRVGLLSKEECWELFCIIAFSRKSGEERLGLEEMGREFVGRCKGLPLAVKTIAGVLRFKERRMEWQSVLDSQLWGLEEVHRDIVGPLWLSYYDLPSPLKQCFSYCAIFPKDYEMEKYELINHWIAQGYIKGTPSTDVEMIGEDCFRNLVMRSFFQDVEVKNDFTTTVCKMHDIVHDFSQLLVKEECLGIEVHDGSDVVSLDNSFANSLRHLSIMFTWGLRVHDSFYNAKKLLSLHISTPMMDHNPSVELDLRRIFDEFTSLRSLRLHYCSIKEIPCNINKLIHLRELDLSSNYNLDELPDATWELFNLQILILGGYCSKLSIPEGLGKLTNLSHLSYGGDFPWPREMLSLTCLRRLDQLIIDPSDDETFSLKHLKNFSQLGGSLDIKWRPRDRHNLVEDAKQAHLKDKKYITRLSLSFGFGKQDEELVEALGAPPNLEALRIYHYDGLRTPNWLCSLTVLKMVDLEYWPKFEHLPSNLGKLLCLGDLRLENFWSVKKVDAEFLGMHDMMLPSSSTTVPLFPKLTYLQFSGFRNWEEWNNVDVDVGDEKLIMPSLTYLQLAYCKKLKALPNFILNKTSLQLYISDCDALQQLD